MSLTPYVLDVQGMPGMTPGRHHRFRYQTADEAWMAARRFAQSGADVIPEEKAATAPLFCNWQAYMAIVRSWLASLPR